MRITCAAREPVLNLPNGNAYLLLLKKSSLYVICGGKLGRKPKGSKALSPLLFFLYTATCLTPYVFSATPTRPDQAAKAGRFGNLQRNTFEPVLAEYH
jgi:hypothetical protein